MKLPFFAILSSSTGLWVACEEPVWFIYSSSIIQKQKQSKIFQEGLLSWNNHIFYKEMIKAIMLFFENGGENFCFLQRGLDQAHK